MSGIYSTRLNLQYKIVSFLTTLWGQLENIITLELKTLDTTPQATISKMTTVLRRGGMYKISTYI